MKFLQIAILGLILVSALRADEPSEAEARRGRGSRRPHTGRPGGRGPRSEPEEAQPQNVNFRMLDGLFNNIKNVASKKVELLNQLSSKKAEIAQNLSSKKAQIIQQLSSKKAEILNNFNQNGNNGNQNENVPEETGAFFGNLFGGNQNQNVQDLANKFRDILNQNQDRIQTVLNNISPENREKLQNALNNALNKLNANVPSETNARRGGNGGRRGSKRPCTGRTRQN